LSTVRLRSGIALEVWQEARIDVSLQAGTLTEQVEVSAAAPLVSSENAALGNVVDNQKMVELPLNGPSLADCSRRDIWKRWQKHSARSRAAEF
jgi:hypothetical protein